MRMAVDGGVFKALLGLAARRTLVCSFCRLGKTASCRLRFKSYHCKCFEFSCFEFSCFRTVQEYPPQFGKAIHHWWRTQKHVLVTHGISWLKKNNHFCWHCCRTQKHLLRTQGHSWLSILFVGVSKCKWPVIVLHGVFVAILNKFHDRLERRQRLMMYSSDTAKQEMQCEIIDYLTQAAYDSMRSHFTPTIEWCQKVVLRHWTTSD